MGRGEQDLVKADGPLSGIRVLELPAIGPAPFATMLLADLGAEVIRVDRPASAGGFPPDIGMSGILRGRRSLTLDLKQEAAQRVALQLVERSDVLIEGWRPGVAERLGVGPDTCLERNPALVYARMTGWGQEGPLAPLAGHDINYAAIAGGLHPVGQRAAPPPPPLNLVADFGGGSLYLVMGVLAALVERASSGRGQVIDVAMVDGVASLTAMFHGLMASGSWLAERESNFLDGGAHFYTTYETADGAYMSVGALEPQFYAELLERLGLDLDPSQQYDRETWPRCKEQLATVFRSRTRAEWVAIFEASDACVAPVLSLAEAPQHPHLQARGTFLDDAGDRLPAPAPRLSRTPASPGPAFPDLGQHTDEILTELGLSGEEIAELREAQAAG